MDYQRANTDWLANCTLGIGVHWTAQSAPRKGGPLPFAQAVTCFRKDEFLGAVNASGAEYVIFTLAHALQMLPCPHPVVDGILPSRTTERDLLGELAQGVETAGKRLIVYYNHSCNQGDDPPWENAVGYHLPSKERLTENILSIVRWLGERYGPAIAGWWFDSAYSLDLRGPRPPRQMTVDLRGFQFPWERLTVAAKAGNPHRLVTYNAGVGQTFLFSDHQDYWAGELVDLNSPPAARFLDNGLQWHGWTCLDDRDWLYSDNSRAPHPPLYPDEAVVAFLSACGRHRAPMCFNVVAFQDGTVAEESVRQLSRAAHALKGGGSPDSHYA